MTFVECTERSMHGRYCKAMLKPLRTGLFEFLCALCPTGGLGLPAVGTRGLFLLETRISQEMDETACAHQVSIGTLWWEGKKKLRHQSNKVQGESKEEVYIMVDDEWAEAQGRNI